MRTPVDAVRSVKKYVSLALGPEWEVRLTGEEGAFTRPFARVGTATGTRMTPRGQFGAEVQQSFSVVCHPVEMATPDDARLEAARVQGLLVQAFTVGVHAPSFGRKVGGFVRDGVAYSYGRAHPARIPLYDFSGLTPDQAAPESARDSSDFLRVVGDITTEVVGDPNDELLYAVTATAAMSWWLSAAVLSEAMTLLHVYAEVEES